jgi:hypothetical protein
VTFEKLSRQSQQAFEPYAAMIYFAPEAFANYKALGLRGRQSYFCSRSAPLGRLPGEVVAATFYNFNPAFVIEQVNSGWAVTTPEPVIEARKAAVTEALHRLLDPAEGEEDLTGKVERALPLITKATTGLPLAGRALFAGHTALAWPDEPLAALWHGVNLLREFRGDGHIVALMSEGISGVESILLQAAFSTRISLAFLQRSRAWDEAAIQAGQKQLAERDLLRDGTLTDKGRVVRERIEEITDRLDTAPFENLGAEASQQLIELVGSLSQRIIERDGLNRG